MLVTVDRQVYTTFVVLGFALDAHDLTAKVFPLPGSAVTSPMPPVRQRWSSLACTCRMSSVGCASDAARPFAKGFDPML